MLINGNRVILERWLLEEVLEKRIKNFGVKIEDLFLVLPAPGGFEGDDFVETNFGRLRVFFSRGIEDTNVRLLHRSRYDYPKLASEKIDRNGKLIS